MLRHTTSGACNLFKTSLFLKNSTFLQCRTFTPEAQLNYEPNSPEQTALKQSLKQLLHEQIEIPIAIGDMQHHSGDIHMQRMPHNWRCSIASMSWANRKMVEIAIDMAKEAQCEWCTKPVCERTEIWRKCANILAKDDRHLLNASIMLGQGKTLRQAEEDTCRTINDIRRFADMLSQNEQAAKEDCEHLMRPTGGFIAAITPYNWTSCSANLALCPALMGNCVLWMPSQFSVLSCYLIWLALQKADLPLGVINFVPSNPNYFVENIAKSPELAGINFAGGMFSYQNTARTLSAQMERQNSFMSAIGPKDSKNFHLVHESADVETVAAATALAAFDYSGQRGSSCECLFVPSSMWCDLKEALIAHMSEMKLGDVCEEDTKVSAVINKPSYERIVGFLEHAENHSETCEIVHGGCRNATYGFFIEPTLIVCNSLDTKIMQEQIEGPVLGVYVYDNNELEEIVKHLANKHQYTLSGAIFSEDDQVAENMGEALMNVAANLYINKPCIGSVGGATLEQPCFPKAIHGDAKCQLHHWLPPCY